MDPINKDINKANTLKGEFYKTEGSLNNCKDLIFSKTWQLICEESKVPLSNNAWPFLFMDGFYLDHAYASPLPCYLQFYGFFELKIVFVSPIVSALCRCIFV